jgi:formylglycine-generating enzyme required for sulfatase activity
MIRFVWAVLFSLLFLSTPTVATAKARIALVVGVSDYEGLRRIDGATSDAAKIASSLSALGFVSPQGRLGVVVDPDRAQLERDLAAFRKALSDAGPDAIGFFYFAGHGLALDIDADFIVPRTTAARLAGDVIGVRQIVADLASVETSGLVVVIDACRDVPHASWLAALRARQQAVVDRPAARSTIYLLQSTSPGSRTADESGDLGARYGAPFATFLASALTRRGATVIDTFRDVSQSAADAAQGIGPPTWQLVNRAGDEPICLTNCPPASATRIADCPLCPWMRVTPRQSAMVGSPRSEAGRDEDEQQVSHTLDGDLLVAETEVTIGEWANCERFGPCRRISPAFRSWPRAAPIADVTLEDARTYIRWLSAISGKSYRLPTSEEWEVAARAGSAAPFDAGAGISPRDAAYNYATQCGAGMARAALDALLRSSPPPERTMAVRSFEPNDYGLFDMRGNAWEWTEGCARRGCVRRGKAIVRGGSVWSAACELRAANQHWMDVGAKRKDLGFRVVRRR